jgi:hypothetical protein
LAVDELQRGLAGFQEDDPTVRRGPVGALGQAQHVAVEPDRGVVIGCGDDKA